MQDSLDEKITCFLCDYGLFLLACFAVLLVAWLRFWPELPASNTPLPTQTPAATAFISPPPGTLPVTTTTPLPVPTFMPTSVPPSTTQTFVIAFIPLNWEGSRTSFEETAHAHAENFIEETSIEAYFQVHTIMVDQPLEHQDLSGGDLVFNLLSHAATNNITADRYVGLTDGDLSPDGSSDVVGWAAGEQGLVSEAQDAYVTSHELGHTFGLCDEYSFVEWTRQNAEFTGGCPNPYPDSCPKTQANGVVCDGTPTADGENSIMASAGLFGEYGFNQACLDHLHASFARLLELRETTQ